MLVPNALFLCRLSCGNLFLSAVDTYEYESGTLLECPIYSFGGDEDGELKMGSWGMESLSNKSENALFPGGSFFLLDPDSEVSATGSHTIETYPLLPKIWQEGKIKKCAHGKA